MVILPVKITEEYIVITRMKDQSQVQQMYTHHFRSTATSFIPQKHWFISFLWLIFYTMFYHNFLIIGSTMRHCSEHFLRKKTLTLLSCLSLKEKLVILGNVCIRFPIQLYVNVLWLFLGFLEFCSHGVAQSPRNSLAHNLIANRSSAVAAYLTEKHESGMEMELISQIYHYSFN